VGLEHVVDDREAHHDCAGRVDGSQEHVEDDAESIRRVPLARALW
jgi:hypothetical protein